MIHLQVHLQIPCYDFLILQMIWFTKLFSNIVFPLATNQNNSPDHDATKASKLLFRPFLSAIMGVTYSIQIEIETRSYHHCASLMQRNDCERLA